MVIQQSIPNPFGITTFGSSIIRVEPDVASLKFAVSRLRQRPKDSFYQAQKAAKAVRAYLAETKVDDVSSSRVSLSQSFKHNDGENRFVGYIAKMEFHVLLHNLERVEEILTGITNVGANEIDSINYQTSRLKEIQQQAQKQAVIAACTKAKIYCQTVGIVLGPVIHIEDVPLEQRHKWENHSVRQASSDLTRPLNTFDPNTIMIGAAVMVSFKLAKA